MASIVQLFIIAAAIATVCGQTYPVTSSSRDYYLISQREFLHEIEIVDLEIRSVNARYADRLDVIQSQQQQLLKEIVQTNRTLMPLQALNLSRKRCIQTYDSQLVTYDNAKYQMKLCYDKAAGILTSLTANAELKTSSAKNEVSYTMPSNAVKCDKAHPKNDTLLQQCYVNSVDTSSENVDYYLNGARDQLAKSVFDSSVASKTAVQCSFKVEKNTLETIGRTVKIIDDCEIALNKPKSVAVFSNDESMGVQSLLMGKITGH